MKKLLLLICLVWLVLPNGDLFNVQSGSTIRLDGKCLSPVLNSDVKCVVLAIPGLGEFEVFRGGPAKWDAYVNRLFGVLTVVE